MATEAEFIKQVQDEMTGSGALPVVLEEPEIKRIINQSSKWFYENWESAVETGHYVVQKNSFNDPEFKKNRTIILPPCVVSVYEFKEISGIGRLGNVDRDLSENKLIASEIFLSAFHGDDLVLRTAQYQFFDLSKAFFLQQIAYDFNRNTHRLKVLGRDPKFDVYIKTYNKIPLEYLLDDIYFLRYVTAKSKISLARILGMYKFNLPGGIEVNSDLLKDEGEQELEWLLGRIDEENTPSWFFMYH